MKKLFIAVLAAAAFVGCGELSTKDLRGNKAVAAPNGYILPPGYTFAPATNNVKKPVALEVGPYTQVKVQGAGLGIAGAIQAFSKGTAYNSTSTNIAGGVNVGFASGAVDVSTNNANVIKAAGDAVGEGIGAAAKTAVKP